MNINDVIISAILKKSFYGCLAASMARRLDETIDTMGVSFVTRPVLYYSQAFLDTMTLSEAREVIYHELLHLILLHPFRKNGRNHAVFNLACDIAVNEKLEKKKLPKGCFTLESARETFPNIDFKKDLCAEEYYDLLMQDSLIKEKIKETETTYIVSSGKDGEKCIVQKMDPNGEMTDVSEEFAKKIIKEAIKQAGILPSNLSKEIDTLYGDAQLNWRQLMKNYLSGRGRIQYRKTHMRESRRFADTMGRRKQVGIKALLAIDTSGSVSDEEYKQFINEIKQIQRITGANIYVTQCDADVNAPIPLQRFVKQPTRHGYGGTDFRPVFELANKMQFPVVVYLTDGFGPAPKIAHQKVLWILTKDGKKPADYGDMARLEA